MRGWVVIAPRKRAARAAGLVWVLALALASPVGAGLPDGLVVTLLIEDEWSLHRAEADTGHLVPVPTVGEPRSPAIAADQRRLAYIDPAGDVREVDLATGADRIIAEPADADAFAHIQYLPGGDLVAVRLRDGRSQNTDVVRLTRDGEARALLKQPSAQFELSTAADGSVYYGNVHCVQGCGRPIQEIWRYDPDVPRAEQLTLKGAVSRQPYPAPDGSVLFSSNASGSYAIWRLDPEGRHSEQLTQSTGVDAWPVADANNTIYFLRRTPAGRKLMRLREDSGEAEAVELQRAYDDVKDLRLAR